MLTRSMRFAEASAVIPLDFVRLPLSALIGFYFFMEVPDTWTVVGALIIGVSAVYIARNEAMNPGRRDRYSS
ncbi:MAG: EamA family transporter, partial [Alphaproteobacteria bacterium]|nr:EamA family transporter [Alphaproteobacteria bacterium]